MLDFRIQPLIMICDEGVIEFRNQVVIGRKNQSVKVFILKNTRVGVPRSKGRIMESHQLKVSMFLEEDRLDN